MHNQGAGRDDNSIMNMPATLRAPSRMRLNADNRDTRDRVHRKGKEKQKAEEIRQRHGMFANFASYTGRNRNKSGCKPGTELHNRKGHAVKMVNVATVTSKKFIAAGGDQNVASNSQRLTHESESSESSGPSPSPSAHAPSPHAVEGGGGEESPSSDHGFIDTLRYCLCIPSCK
ncbi:hypothetical protein CONPUDRAFT_74948 [Coniophora puteana RWD-64-598 SS2]|uniref:Uncharacterized protein n=1 Tax=Coniophora puteana (strain RWD-64-598) TaxID=741705 RepID=A0A5M3MHE7_CONPW|nr:uncharacterized protein CONPUDRAFT_74948 [Coniophora puteana RWD-64-598 SS2]EIW78204.1 hypothetical protein CONPUDRAFT_74948 [Coniophora puteana RWD-64-598 SS2]